MPEIQVSIVQKFESVALASEQPFAIYKITSPSIASGHLGVPTAELGNLLALTSHALGQSGAPAISGLVADFMIADHPTNPNSRLMSLTLANGMAFSFEVPRITCMLMSDNLMTRL